MPPTSSIVSTELANEMYWSSPRTVEEIARELNVSRSTFYASVRPIGAGTSCPVCGEAMVFTNRSNREAGLSSCQSCPPAASPSSFDAESGDRQFSGSDGESMSDFSDTWTRWRDELSAVSPQRAALVGGAAALGVVVGAAATRMIQER